MSEEVACWPFPAHWPPAGNEGGGTDVAAEQAAWPGGLESVSATVLAAPAMWQMSLVYSATYASCLHCRTVQGSETRAMAWVNGLWSVYTTNLWPSRR
jgi:hypothetical protein